MKNNENETTSRHPDASRHDKSPSVTKFKEGNLGHNWFNGPIHSMTFVTRLALATWRVSYLWNDGMDGCLTSVPHVFFHCFIESFMEYGLQ